MNTEYRKGFSLPRELYTSDDWFAKDMAMLGKQWLMVGTLASIPEEGDYQVVNIGHTSVILLRDEDGGVRALHNSCCHRGARLCESTGSCSRLVCPYHGWTYNFDGQLIFAGHMSNAFRMQDYQLTKIAVELISGLIFICLDDNPPNSIHQVRKLIEPYLGPYQIANTKVALQTDIIEQGNWKLVMENNRECYHCAPNHPELLNSYHPFSIESPPSNRDMQLYDELTGGDNWTDIPPPIMGEYVDSEMAADYEKLLAAKRLEWDNMGLQHRLLDFPRGLWFRTERLPLQETAVSHTLNGKLGCNVLLPPFTKAESSGLHLWTNPNSWNHLLCDHIINFCALPIDAGSTLLRTTWLVHKDAREGVDYDVQNLADVWTKTNNQDRRLVENNQAGILSPSYKPGPYSAKTERYVENFIDWYATQMDLGSTAT